MLHYFILIDLKTCIGIFNTLAYSNTPRRIGMSLIDLGIHPKFVYYLCEVKEGYGNNEYRSICTLCTGKG